MMSKKTFSFFSVSSYSIGILCLCVMLFSITCSDPSSFDESSIPSGMGRFSLSLWETNASRNIMPGEININTFANYTLTFYQTGTETVRATHTLVPVGNALPPVNLLVGIYDLVVTGNTAQGAAARGRTNGIQIVENELTSATVLLSLIPADGTGAGTFSWTIGLPAGITVAEMTITPVNPSGTAAQTINLLTRASSSENLNSGFYNVYFSVTRPGNNLVQRWDILHIYQNMPSNFNLTFTENYFSEIYHTVTFKQNNGDNDLPQSVLYGSAVPKPVDPIRAGWFFGGWYEDDVTFNVPWDFDTPITENMTLYAKWGKVRVLYWDNTEEIETVHITLGEAFSFINTNGANEYLVNIIEDSDPYPLAPVTLNGTGMDVTIEPSPSAGTVTVQLSANGNMFTVNAGVTLTLEDGVTLEGQKIGGNGNQNNSGTVIQVNTDGNFIMNGGQISDNHRQYGSGGGVGINNGTFIMKGGKIIDNDTSSGAMGGAVSVGTNGCFIMSGGEISGNTSTTSGGGVNVGNGTFIVGGTAKIFGNTREVNSSNVHLMNNCFITIGTGDNGAPAPAPGMEVWVQTATASGVIVQDGASAAIANYFHADQVDRGVVYRLTDGPPEQRQLVIVNQGSAEAPFLIHTEAQLRMVGRGSETPPPAGYENWTLTAHYKLMESITLPEPSATENNWTPIAKVGSVNNTFTGSFDGNNHTITGIRFNVLTGTNHGFMANLGEGGEVKDLGLVDFRIPNTTSGSWIGGIAGDSGGTIINCYVTTDESSFFRVGGASGGIAGRNQGAGTIKNSYYSGRLVGTGNDVGGIAGQNQGLVEDCYVIGEVTSNADSVGGIVGWNRDTTPAPVVRNSYATSAVSGVNNVGGIVGANIGIVENCFATGNVSGERKVGGVVGASTRTVKNSYATGDVTGTDSIIGGIVGHNDGVNSIVENCYSTGTVSGTSDVGGAVGANDGSVQNSVALNLALIRTTGAEATFGRLTGIYNGTISNNRARSNMTVPTGITATPDANGIHGADAMQGTALSTVFAGWDPAVWNIVGNLGVGGVLPTLWGIPESVQNPVMP